MRIVRNIAAIASVAITAFGCGNSTEPSSDLEVSLAVAPTAFHIGDSTVVTVTTTNRASQPRTIQTKDCFSDFYVVDSVGTIVGPRGKRCAAFAVPIILAPGQSYVVTQLWRGQAATDDSNAPTTYVVPGEYVIRVDPGQGTPSVAARVMP